MILINKYKWALGSLAIILIYLVYFFYFADNLPREDDYVYLFDFKNFSEIGILEKFKIIFSVKNSHPSLSAYLLGWVQLIFTGKINFIFNLIFGLGFLGLVFYVISKVFEEIKWESVFISSLLILNPISTFTVLFPLANSQYCILFGLLFTTLYLVLYKPTTYDILPIILAFFATFTFGNGIAIWPIVFLLLLIKKEYKKLIYWALGFLVTLVIFKLNYKNTGLSVNPFEVIKNFKNIVSFLFLFPGSSLDYFPGLLFSNLSSFRIFDIVFFGLRGGTMVGFSILFYGLIIWAIFKFYKGKFFSNEISLKRFYFVFGIISFLLFTNFIGSIFRSQLGLQSAINYRYKFFGQMHLVAMFFMLFVLFGRKTLKFIIPVVVIHWILIWLVYFNLSQNYKTKYLASAYNLNQNLKPYIFHGFYDGAFENYIYYELLPVLNKTKIFSFDQEKYKTPNFKNLKINNEEVFGSINDNILNIKKNNLRPLSNYFFIYEEEGKNHFVPLEVPLFPNSPTLNGVLIKNTILNPSSEYMMIEKNHNEFYVFKIKIK